MAGRKPGDWRPDGFCHRCSSLLCKPVLPVSTIVCGVCSRALLPNLRLRHASYSQRPRVLSAEAP